MNYKDAPGEKGALWWKLLTGNALEEGGCNTGNLSWCLSTGGVCSCLRREIKKNIRGRVIWFRKTGM